MKKKIILIIVVVVLILLGVGGYCLYQFTEVFGKKLIPIKINSLIIDYVPGYDFNEANSFNQEENQKIEIQKISLKGEELKIIQKELKKIQESSASKKDFYYKYEITINKKVTLQVGNDSNGYLLEGKKKTQVSIPKTTLQKIDAIVEENNEKVISTLSSESFQIKMDGASISLKNPDNIKYIKNSLDYYPITVEHDYHTFQDGYRVELLLDNNIKVYLYDSKIGYILQKDGETDKSTFVIFTDDLYDLVQKIYNVSIQ